MCVALAGCARDATITRGADSESHWLRRVTKAVPKGTSLDDARSIMERNGFKCGTIAAGPEALECEKTSTTRLGLVRRRWHAWFSAVDARVTAVRGSTELLHE